MQRIAEHRYIISLRDHTYRQDLLRSIVFEEYHSY